MRLMRRLALLLAFCTLLSGCHTRPKPMGVITIATFSHAIDYSPFYVARHFGWFGAEPALKGITINYRELNDRDQIASAMDAGQLEAVFAAEPPIIITSAQGTHLRIVEESCALQQEIVVRSKLPVHTVMELKGKTVAVLRGTSSHYGLTKILRSAGLKPMLDVNIVFMSPDSARSAFESGKIDSWAVWPPFTEEEEVSGKGRVVTGGDAIINSVMAVPDRLLNQNEPIAQALVKVIRQSKEWIRAHPEEAPEVIASELQLEPRVVAAAWGKHDWSAHLTPNVITDIQQKADFLAKEDLTRGSKDVQVSRDLVDLRYETK